MANQAQPRSAPSAAQRLVASRNNGIRRFGSVALIAVSLAALVIAPVPIWGVVWVASAVLLLVWPHPEAGQWAPGTPEAGRAAKILAQRKFLIRPLTRNPWRLGAEGDNDGCYGGGGMIHMEQSAKRFKWRSLWAWAARLRRQKDDKSEPRPPREPRMIALNTLAAALVAVASIGAEWLLAFGVHSIDWPSAGEWQSVGWPPAAAYWAERVTSAGRPAWLLYLAGPMGWAATKTFAAWRRLSNAADICLDSQIGWTTPVTCAPTAFWSNLHADAAAPKATQHIKKLALGIESFVALMISGAGSVLAFVVGGVGLAVPATMFLLPLGALIVCGVALKEWIGEQRQQWSELMTESVKWRVVWDQVLPSNKKARPQLLDCDYLPDAPPGDRSETPPLVKRLVFSLPVGVDFASVSKLTSVIKPAVKSDLVRVAPGVASGTREATWAFFAVWHAMPAFNAWASSRAVQWEEWHRTWGIEVDKETAYHDPTAPADIRNFAFNRKLDKAMQDLGIGELLSTETPSLRSAGADCPAYLLFSVPLHGKAAYASLVKNLDRLAEVLRAEWLRFELPSSDGIARGHMCAVHPDRVRLPPQMRKAARLEIARLDWQRWMGVVGLVGSDKMSTPSMAESTVVNRGNDPKAAIKRLKFRLPPGLTLGRVEDSIDEISAASNFQYIAVEPAALPSECMVMCGTKDPLDDTYLFADYADKGIAPKEAKMIGVPDPGNPRTGWCVGIGSQGQPMHMEWDHEEAHLLVAGGTGAGKSMLINSMLIQLMCNNTKDDIELWMLEPKNELHKFRHKQHVRVFIDQYTTSQSLYAVAATTFEALVQEMNRRFRLMHEHPSQPLKISEARHIAATDPACAHLAFRYIFCIVEECATFYEKPPSAEKENYDRMLRNLSELVRKARAAGIHIVNCTQDPKKDAIPMVAKRQSRRIGLRTNDTMGSLVIIDRPGLEDIKEPGRGMMTGDHGYVGYRSFFMRKPDEKHPNDPDDFSNWLDRVPDDEIPREHKLPPGLDYQPPPEADWAPAVQ